MSVTKPFTGSAAPRIGVALALGLVLAGCATSRMPAKASLPAPAPAPVADAQRVNALGDEMRAWAATHGTALRRSWGVDIVGVRLVSTGWMLEFKYRVLDAQKAASLLDEHVKPYLVDDVTGARLAVPAMENVGELRQHTAPHENQIYFTLFGNASRVVERGGHVTVVIGGFQAAGLPVM